MGLGGAGFLQVQGWAVTKAGEGQTGVGKD